MIDNQTSENISTLNENSSLNQNVSKFDKISSKYKLKFYNFFLNSYLNRYGGYNLDHDEMIYKIANFGSKINQNYLSFAFGAKEDDMYGLIDMLEQFQIFDIKQIQPGIVQIYFPFTEEKIKWLKYKRSKTQQQKKLKQMILDCYKKLKSIKIE